MLQTLRGWSSNAFHELSLTWAEPVSWLLLAASFALVIWRWRRGAMAGPSPWVVHVGLTAWLIATLAITIYPMDVSFDPPPWQRLQIESVVPLVGTVQSLGHMRDRTMTVDEHEGMTEKIATDLGIPREEVNLGWEVRGTSPAGVLRDPLGNTLLFMPLGFLLVVAQRRRTWQQVGLAAASVSLGIEASQLLFGFGSLASIDDVIFNTVGALLGLGAFRLLQRSTYWLGRLMKHVAGSGHALSGTAAPRSAVIESHITDI